MTPPSLLVDWTFIEALVDPAHERRDDAHRQYHHLLHAYERHELRLRARHDHLDRAGERVGGWHAAPAARALLAPVARIHVAGQHRRAATRLDLPFAVDDDVAVTLVVLRRERITRIATFHPVFDAIDLGIVA